MASVLLLLSFPALDVMGGAARPTRKTPPGPVVAEQSAALFIGIREFPSDPKLQPVRYAADDAVDLAFAMAIDGHPRLVDPKRAVLALSGEPQKESSKEKLNQLRAAGATIERAGQTEILTLLENQAGVVGADGLLIVSFATHGINDEGTQYLLTADSMLRHRETALSETKVREIVSRAKVPRSLILIDACRERLTSDSRTGQPDPRSAAALRKTMGEISGQVVFSAAAAGQYAYDDDTRRNGVFTAAILDGLRCGAATGPEGFVTVDTLSNYVEEAVLSWVRKHENRDVRHATQLDCQGHSRRMPLSACVNHTSGAPPAPAH